MRVNTSGGSRARPSPVAVVDSAGTTDSGIAMNRLKQKAKRRVRRKMRVRKRIFGTTERPRLTVFRSLQHIYAQVIDDTTGCTLLDASTVSKELRGSVGYGGNAASAKQVGKLLAERATAKGLRELVFDRNGYRFHGRVKALVEAVREGGVKV